MSEQLKKVRAVGGRAVGGREVGGREVGGGKWRWGEGMTVVTFETQGGGWGERELPERTRSGTGIGSQYETAWSVAQENEGMRNRMRE